MPPEYIAYDDPLMVACEDALKQYWRKPKIFLARRPKYARGTFHCDIDTSKNADVRVEEKANSAMPLPVVAIRPFNPSDSFFFGIRFRFDHELEETFALSSASIHVFAGRKLTPLVRAEWDRRDIGRTRHAQPHWHLLGAQESAQLSGEGPSPLEFTPQTEVSEVGLERIHFPVSASWHQSASVNYQHPFVQRQHLLNWILGLTQYLGEQLVYVSAKAPLKQQGEAVTFSPSKNA